jgi:hypothetical protein
MVNNMSPVVIPCESLILGIIDLPVMLQPLMPQNTLRGRTLRKGVPFSNCLVLGGDLMQFLKNQGPFTPCS